MSKPAKAKISALLWARVSTEEQGRKSSNQNQISAARRWAKKNGATVEKEIVSSGSASYVLFEDACTQRKDPAYAQLRDWVQSGKINALVFYHIDRIGRTTALITTIVEFCLENGVALIDLSSPPATFSAEEQKKSISTIIATVFQAVSSEIEVRRLSEKSYTGRVERAKQGKFSGSLNTGYRYKYNEETGAPESVYIYEAEMEKVRQMFRLYLSGLSTRAIGKRIDVSTGTINSILRSGMVYAGYVRFSGEWYKGEHEPIISVDQAEEVLRLMKIQARGELRGAYVYSGIVTCERCNAPMAAQTDERRAVGNERFYKCPSCYTTAPERDLNSAFFGFLEEYKDRLIGISLEPEPSKNNPENDIAYWRDRLDRLNEAYARADEGFALHGDIDRYDTLLKKLDLQREGIEKKIDKLLSTAPKPLEEKLEIIDYLLTEVIEGDARYVNLRLREHFHFIRTKQKSIIIQCSLT